MPPYTAATDVPARLLALDEATTDFVGTMGPDGRIDYVNRAGRRLLGIADAAELGSWRAPDCFAPDTVERVTGEGVPSARRDGRWSGDGALIGAGGEHIPVAITIVAHGVEADSYSIVMRDRRVPAAATAHAHEVEHRALLAALPLIVYHVDPRPPFTPLYVSPSVATLGYTLDEWLAVPGFWIGVLHPDDRARVLAETEDALMAGRAVDYEYRVVTKDGGIRWIHDRGDFVRDGRGVPVAWQGIMVDVTAQRLAEDALRLSEGRFRAMFDCAAVGVSVVDDTGTILQANAAFETFLGYGPGEVLGRKATGFSPAEDSAITRQPVAEIKAGLRQSATVEKRFIRRDGDVRWATLTLSRLTLGDGRDGILGVTTDVTDRRRAEAALERERAFLSATLESLSDGVVACDADGQLALFNRATREFHGLPETPLPPEEWAGRYNLFRADGVTPLPVEEIPLRRAFRGEEVHDAEMVIAPLGAPRRTVRTSGRPIHAPDGTALGAVVAMRDVTEQLRAETAVERERAFLHSVLESLSENVSVCSPDGQLTLFNRATIETHGLPDPTLALERWSEQFHVFLPDGITPFPTDELPHERVLATQADALGIEYVVRGAGRPARTLVANAHALRAADGTFLGSVCAARDMTAQKAAERALQTSVARFGAALEGGRFGFVALAAVRDAAGAVVDFDVAAVNGQGAALIGLPEAELIGQRYGDVLPLARDAGHVAAYARVLVTGIAREFDVRVTDPRFTAEWLRVQAVPLDDIAGDGTADGVALMVRDISGQKRAEREVRLLTDVTHALAAAPDLAAATRAALAAMCSASGWEYGEAWLVEEAADPWATAGIAGSVAGVRLVHGPVWHRHGDERLARYASASGAFTFGRGDGLPGRAWQEGVPVVVPHLDAPGIDFSRLAHAAAAGLRSGVAVPVLADGVVIAVLNFHTRDPGQVGHAPVTLLAAVAAQVGTAVRRKLAEAALAEREARLALIYNGATDLMFLMRVERTAAGEAVRFRCESVNDAYLAVTGLTRSQLIGRTVEEILPPTSAAAAIEQYALALQTGEVRRYDETVELPTARLTVETTLTPVLDDAGRCTHLMGAARDVSATRRAEATIRDSEARFRGVLENLRVPAVQLDRDGCVTFANEALLALTGWTRAEIVGFDWFSRFVPDARPFRAAFREMVALRQLPPHHESEILTREGTRRSMAWDNVLLTNADGHVTGTASVGHDVTERRALEARLAALSEHDELTGMLNRRGFRRMASHAIKSAVRTRRHDAILYVDLDHLKPINDQHGHAAGDEALRAVARVINATVRDADFGARLGGDEFAVYAVGLREGEGHVMAARLRANLDAHNAVADASGRSFRVEFSVGVAELEDGDDLDLLLARSDAALYAQKLARRS